MKKNFYLLFAALVLLSGCTTNTNSAEPTETSMEEKPMPYYNFPSEEKKHEGTWLTWPHQYTYGIEYREEIEDIWVQMVDALHSGENVHIVAYDEKEKQRIKNVLKQAEISMDNVDFVIAKSDDVWSRDTGPMFVFDENNKLTIADFAFDGWGKKTPYEYDDQIPKAVATAKKLPIIEIPSFVLEGGAVELDGVTDQDVTAAHIDGMARFYQCHLVNDFNSYT